MTPQELTADFCRFASADPVALVVVERCVKREAHGAEALFGGRVGDMVPILSDCVEALVGGLPQVPGMTRTQVHAL